MIRLRYLSPFKFNNTLLYKRFSNFSVQNTPPPQNDPKPNQNQNQQTPPPENPENQSNLHQKTSFTYNPQQFQTDSNQNFLNRLERMERGKNAGGKRRIDGFIFPALLCLTSLFLYHCWQTVPYNNVYKHATINEYINQKGYYHAIFLGSLSFQNTGHLVLYFPGMVYSLVLLSKYLKQRHLALLFVSNSILTMLATYYFERYNKKISPMLTPKANGSVTPLCFLSTFLMINPTHFIFNNRMLPFFLIPAIYYMNEWQEFEMGSQNEVSRPVHFTAIGYGMLCGLIFKFLLTRGKI